MLNQTGLRISYSYRLLDIWQFFGSSMVESAPPLPERSASNRVMLMSCAVRKLNKKL
jgi:hypothetical protein